MERPVLNDIPGTLKGFIAGFIRSYAAWDVITFFFGVTGAVSADAEEIASSIGRDEKEVRPVLELLVAEGILRAEESSTGRVYAPASGGKEAYPIDEFLEFTGTKDGRLKTIYMITAERFRQENN